MSSELLESSDDDYEYCNRTGAKDINGNVNGEGDKNTDAGRGYAELIGFLSLRAQTEVLDAMEKA